MRVSIVWSHPTLPCQLAVTLSPVHTSPRTLPSVIPVFNSSRTPQSTMIDANSHFTPQCGHHRMYSVHPTGSHITVHIAFIIDVLMKLSLVLCVNDIFTVATLNETWSFTLSAAFDQSTYRFLSPKPLDTPRFMVQWKGSYWTNCVTTVCDHSRRAIVIYNALVCYPSLGRLSAQLLVGISAKLNDNRWKTGLPTPAYSRGGRANGRTMGEHWNLWEHVM